MINYWPIITIIAITFLGLIFYLLTNKSANYNSNYQNEHFENFLNVLKDATATEENDSVDDTTDEDTTEQEE